MRYIDSTETQSIAGAGCTITETADTINMICRYTGPSDDSIYKADYDEYRNLYKSTCKGVNFDWESTDYGWFITSSVSTISSIPNRCKIET